MISVPLTSQRSLDLLFFLISLNLSNSVCVPVPYLQSSTPFLSSTPSPIHTAYGSTVQSEAGLLPSSAGEGRVHSLQLCQQTVAQTDTHPPNTHKHTDLPLSSLPFSLPSLPSICSVFPFTPPPSPLPSLPSSLPPSLSLSPFPPSLPSSLPPSSSQCMFSIPLYTPTLPSPSLLPPSLSLSLTDTLPWRNS